MRLGFTAKARLGLEMLVTYGRVRIALSRNDLPAALERLRGSSPEPRPVDEDARMEALRLGHVVRKGLRAVPGDSRCLMQSLVLTAMLARRGLPSSLIIGVRPGEVFGAHAWVELASRPLLPSGEGTFHRLVEL